MQRQLAFQRGVRRHAAGAGAPTAYDRQEYASRDATRVRLQLGSASFDTANRLRRSNRRGFGSARDQMMTTIRRRTRACDRGLPTAPAHSLGGKRQTNTAPSARNNERLLES
jgi:hypothetical protein